jgi:hypothetical protein
MRVDDPGEVPLKWTPAREAEAVGGRRTRAASALVLVVACLSVGVLIGRHSTSLPFGSRQSGNASPQPGAQPAAPPTLALTSDADKEAKVAPSAESDPLSKKSRSNPPVVLLNPGTTDASRQDDGEGGLHKQKASKISKEPSAQAVEGGLPAETRAKPADRGREGRASSSERDYQALRGYVLSR